MILKFCNLDKIAIEATNRIIVWMTCDFSSFLTVFQSYQGDEWVIMKCLQWNPVYD